MPEPRDPAWFRRQATTIYNAAMAGLALLFVTSVGLGWFLGGVWGLVVGAVAGLFLAGGGAVAATVLWAMSQDGA